MRHISLHITAPSKMVCVWICQVFPRPLPTVCPCTSFLAMVVLWSYGWQYLSVSQSVWYRLSFTMCWMVKTLCIDLQRVKPSDFSNPPVFAHSITGILDLCVNCELSLYWHWSFVSTTIRWISMIFGTDIHASLRMDFHHFGHPLTSCFGGKCHLMQPSSIQLMYEVSDILEAVKRIINVSGWSSIIKN